MRMHLSGSTRDRHLHVAAASSDAEADQAVRAVANSFLVKTGWAGTYPAWSRIVDVLGYCGVEIDPNQLAIRYNDLSVLENSTPTLPDPDALNAIVTSNRYQVTFDLGTGGSGSAVLYTCDCTEDYVRINMF